MKRETAKRAITTLVAGGLLALAVGCERGPAAKKATGVPKMAELEPRPLLPEAKDISSIRVQADEGFLGGPFDETFESAPAIADILQVVQVILTGPREIGDVAKHGKKGRMTIRTKSALAVELVLTDDRAIQSVSAYSISTDRLAEAIKKHRKKM